MTANAKSHAPRKRPAGTVVTIPEFWNPKAGDSSEGVVIGMKPVKGKDGKEKDRYLFKTGDESVDILPSDADLTQKIRQKVEQYGFGARRLYIEKTPEKKDTGKGSPMTVWLVIDVTDASVTSLDSPVAPAPDQPDLFTKAVPE